MRVALRTTKILLSQKGKVIIYLYYLVHAGMQTRKLLIFIVTTSVVMQPLYRNHLFCFAIPFLFACELPYSSSQIIFFDLKGNINQIENLGFVLLVYLDLYTIYV